MCTWGMTSTRWDPIYMASYIVTHENKRATTQIWFLLSTCSHISLVFFCLWSLNAFGENFIVLYCVYLSGTRSLYIWPLLYNLHAIQRQFCLIKYALCSVISQKSKAEHHEWTDFWEMDLWLNCEVLVIVEMFTNVFFHSIHGKNEYIRNLKFDQKIYISIWNFKVLQNSIETSRQWIFFCVQIALTHFSVSTLIAGRKLEKPAWLVAIYRNPLICSYTGFKCV